MQNKKPIFRTPILFFIFGLASLLLALMLGCLAAFQFITPGLFSSLGFVSSRPLHVSLVVAWIFLSAVGGIYFYLAKYHSIKWHFPRGPFAQLLIMIVTGLLIIFCYVNKIFGGREYWEHPVWFAIPIVISWLFLAVNFIKSVMKKSEPWPVYIWMWATGILFFLFTFLESNLWIFPYFRDHLARDMTVQWKSYGALVGSWNMLVYGTATFLISKISGNENASRSRTAFLLYFLGFTNLLFGWAHHTYTLPNAGWIRNVSYVVSMSELIILAKLIYGLRKTISGKEMEIRMIPASFLYASEIWIFLNLVVALLISIPAINLYTHGTHVTVAHAMGSSIGINSMILLSSACFLAATILPEYFTARIRKIISTGLIIANISLFVFWISLLWAGVEKGIMIMRDHKDFYETMHAINPQLTAFAFSGLGILVGLSLVIIPIIIALIKRILIKSS
ncbi:nitric-oxide reductase large subunit [soil metagenome]